MERVQKGIIDFVIAVLAGVTYLNFNGCGVHFLQWSFTLPYAVYLLLIVILIWASINVVNCTDGVDGLSASLAVVTIGTYLLAYKTELAPTPPPVWCSSVRCWPTCGSTPSPPAC